LKKLHELNIIGPCSFRLVRQPLREGHTARDQTRAREEIHRKKRRMKIEALAIPGVVLLTPARFGDSRGWVSESWNRNRLRDAGIDLDFVQDNRSWSAKAGTVRGLHFQVPPHSQAKLVQVMKGAILDVVVDLRRSSLDYGRWISIVLTAEAGQQLLVPAGFAHGFVTRMDETEILYKCSDFYSPQHEGALRFDDPTLGIDWGIDPARAILSDKDGRAAAFATFQSPFA
jgi:dTDP-4-dehydrorhamnose 3,5-epimerase